MRSMPSMPALRSELSPVSIGLHQKDPLAEPLLQQALADIAPAYRILEAGHEMAGVRDALDSLLATERWSSQEITARLDHPRQWDALASEIELSARRLREAGVRGELVSMIDALRWSPSAKEAARKITDRRTRRDAMVGAGYELSELQTQLKAGAGTARSGTDRGSCVDRPICPHDSRNGSTGRGRCTSVTGADDRHGRPG